QGPRPGAEFGGAAPVAQRLDQARALGPQRRRTIVLAEELFRLLTVPQGLAQQLRPLLRPCPRPPRAPCRPPGQQETQLAEVSLQAFLLLLAESTEDGPPAPTPRVHVVTLQDAKRYLLAARGPPWLCPLVQEEAGLEDFLARLLQGVACQLSVLGN